MNKVRICKMNRPSRVVGSVALVGLLTQAFMVTSIVTSTDSAAAGTKFNSHASSVKSIGTSAIPPHFIFHKNTSHPKTYGDRLNAYISVPSFDPRHGQVTWNRQRVIADAGSGLATVVDSCIPYKGPLPSGTYRHEAMFKNWGNKVVKGWVWYLGNKDCPDGGTNGGTNRNALFIHYNGYERRADGITQGCIEIGQGARKTIADLNWVAFDGKYGTTEVWDW